MATIRKRGSKWQVQIRRQGFSAIARTFTAHNDALKWSREQERLLDLGEPLQASKTPEPLTTLLDRYEAEVTPRKRSDSDRYHLRQIRRHEIAKLAIAHLSAEAIAKFRDDRLKSVGPSTVRKEITLLGSVLKHARAEWGIPLKENPVSLVRKPPSAAGRQRRLNADDLHALGMAFEKCRKPIIREIFLFALATGMRRSEVLGLRHGDIDLKNRTAFLPLTKNGESRTVPLSEAAIAILKGRMMADHRDTDRLFPISSNAFRLAWERTKARAKIEDLRFHDLRHEAISRFFELGLTVPEVALISGHRDAKMLFRYTHLRPESVAQKLKALAET